MNDCDINDGFDGGVTCIEQTRGEESIRVFGDGGIFDSLINILLFGAVIASGLFLIFGGIQYITSSGDQNRVTNAKNTILYAILGLVISFIALGLVTFVGGTLQGDEPANNGAGAYTSVVEVV